MCYRLPSAFLKMMSSNTQSLLARYAALTIALTFCVPLAGFLRAHAIPKKPAGDQIYRQQCASCHGAKGEGTQSHSRALVGDRSIGDLGRYIAQYMPPGAPKKLSAEDAQKVAAYIHNAFYSPLAQARNKPARIELSRLTVRQYRNAVADLVGSFRTRPQAASASADRRQGLRGEYFKTGRMRGDQAILQRIDPEIRFDFGATGALKEQDDPYQFAMRWEGSVLAPETGEYEFIVRTEHAARLWVNDLGQPLVDALVKSGDSNEHRASLFLLGGRRYPLRLEFSKGVQGVNNLKKLKEKPPLKASLSLEWKRPKLTAEVIPQRSLFPAISPETFVTAAPFPPDDRSVGYERGTSVSKAWDEATTEAALETAHYVAARLPELSGAADDAADREARIRAFCRQFAERAFRRPLSEETAGFFVERQFKEAPDLETAVKRVVLLVLKSPRFLYREIEATPPSPSPASPVSERPVNGSATPDPYAVASRLSFILWDSVPDDELLRAAAAGQLSTREQVVRQAQRMAADSRARAKLREFFLQWLKVEHHPDLSKDPKRFPDFSESVASDLRTSLEMSIEQVVWSEKSDFRELLLTTKLYLNGRLGKLYNARLAPDAPFRLVTTDSGKRAGVLTHPYLLSSFAYRDENSPIHRGVLIARSLLGRTLLPPPEAFTPLPADLHPKLTTRQRVALQTKPAACASCHSLINPLGFTLEKYDAVGRLRAKENGAAIDATGSYRTRAGKTVRFSDVRDLARFLAESPEAHAAFVEQLFHHLVKQPVRAFGPATPAHLRMTFAANQFSIRRQIVETAAMAAVLEPQSGTDGTISSARHQP